MRPGGFGDRKHRSTATDEHGQEGPEVNILQSVLAGTVNTDQIVNGNDLRIGSAKAVMGGGINKTIVERKSFQLKEDAPKSIPGAGFYDGIAGRGHQSAGVFWFKTRGQDHAVKYLLQIFTAMQGIDADSCDRWSERR